ncbi:MAG: hypothetical protein KAS30_05010, partial [Candidatus Diapherotrites archaeon]|nr:hypothetical protein [Candidatus Diapherotrites archaeon]
MALRLINKIPIIKNSAMMQKYAEYLRNAEFKIDALLWIILSVVIAGFAAIGGYFGGNLLTPTQGIQFALLLFIVLVDILVGYPYLKAKQRIGQIEEALPDALRQMADTL